MEIILDKEKIMQNVTSQDLDMFMSFGFVVRCRMGSIVALRAELTKMFEDNFNYPMLSSNPLFVVHWNDLTVEKQRKLETKSRRR